MTPSASFPGVPASFPAFPASFPASFPALTTSSPAVPVTEARLRIAELVGRTQHGGERILLTKHGRVAAVLVPPADLDRLLALERAVGLAVVEGVTIGESSDVVWASLLGSRTRERWWPGVELVDHVGAELLEQRGGEVVARGDVVSLVPERLLELSWRHESWSASTRVRLELAESVGVTTVRVVHTGWEQLPDGAVLAERQRQRWRSLLTAWCALLTPGNQP